MADSLNETLTAAILNLDISIDEAVGLYEKSLRDQGVDPAAIRQAVDMWRTNLQQWQNARVAQGLPIYQPQSTVVATPQPVPPGGTPTPPGRQATRELASDPFTAYLEKLGIGGKTAYNPAERYQANLFDPLKSLYDINQRLYNPLSDTAAQGKEYGTFSDFLESIGGAGGGQPLYAGAGRQLKSIFGFTPQQKQTPGFEPGRYDVDSAGEAAGGMNPGSLGELQDLFRYGLRPTSGVLGARYAAQSLPQIQQAYYGQKQTGEIGKEANFLDWLKAKYNLSF